MRTALKTIPKFGDHSEDVKLLQAKLKELGYDIKTVDGWFGDKTLKALQKFQKDKGMKGSGAIPENGGNTFLQLNFEFLPPRESELPKPSDLDNFFGASWIGLDLDLLGRKETDQELNLRLVPEWKLEGLNYKTLVGNEHPWCSVRVNYALRKVKVKGTNNAGASSWSKWGRKSPFWFGSVLDIQHKSGGRHVCFFLYWHDEEKKIAVTLDGNRDNTFGIFLTDLSGKADKCVSGPRWSNDLPDGMIVSREKVLTKYPFLKPGSKGTSATTTR